jgi:TolB-like protein/DNA-binding winged helix-turn-helix (wHTH) protein/Flp pilus assembly protein TadD
MGGEKVHLFGEYMLDMARGCLLRGSEVVHLRPQSYEVLKYLVEHRGRLIGKEKLIEEVWRGRAVTDDSLVQCLRDVRQALGDRRGQYVRNVRGRGYIFDAGTAVAEAREPLPIRTEQVDIVRVVVEEEEPVFRRLRDGRRHVSPPVAGLLSITVVALVAGAAWLRSSRSPDSPRIESIAVLPFVNESGDSDAEYLSDGITESLINSLSRLPELSVKARSSVFRYKGREIEPQQIAAELSVEAILTGRAVQRGDDLTLYLSLVDGRTGNQLWGDEYVRKLTDVVVLQREIARDVSQKLQARLSGADQPTLAKDYTANADAYLLYLRGLYHSRKSTQSEIRKGIHFYQQAVQRDPTYALAYAGLADAHRALSIVGDLPSQEAYSQAKAAAVRALEIDPDLPEAHIALGWISFSYDWDWSAAERELRRAIELSPTNSNAHRAYAHLLSNLGRHDEAIAEARRARELDPLMLIANALEGQFLFYAGRDGEAESRYRKTLELDPNYWVAHSGLGRVYIGRQMFPEAIAALTTARELAPGSTESMTQLGYALARSGKREEAEAVLKELRAIAADAYVPAYNFAMIYNGLGRTDEALAQLERSFQAREVQLTFIRIDTRWDALRDEPRFAAIAARMNLE